MVGLKRGSLTSRTPIISALGHVILAAEGEPALRSCPRPWCRSGYPKQCWLPRSGCHSGQSDRGSIAQRSDGFQAHVSGTLDRPFLVLLQQQRTDEAGDGGFVWEDAHYLAASLDLSLQSFQPGGTV